MSSSRGRRGLRGVDEIVQRQDDVQSPAWVDILKGGLQLQETSDDAVNQANRYRHIDNGRLGCPIDGALAPVLDNSKLAALDEGREVW